MNAEMAGFMILSLKLQRNRISVIEDWMLEMEAIKVPVREIRGEKGLIIINTNLAVKQFLY
jgi:hypothetical protein